MIITSLRLRNIRSYEEASMQFPSGTTLLSGDVGSGKSTILYAIEFALFGLLRGEISGSSLLRHGEDKGEVTLAFTLDEVDYEITRTLKRDKTGVSQNAGSLTINNAKEQLTPIELRARILEILGYPATLISKAKSLIYRYTVYTPQEEMKKILFDDPDSRRETLRKIFGIDQYKTIRNNSATVLKELRSEQKMLKSRTQDLPHIQKQLEQVTEQHADAAEGLVKATKEKNTIKKILEKKNQELLKEKESFSKILKAQQAYQQLENKKFQIKTKTESISKELSQLEEQITQSPKQPEHKDYNEELKKHQQLLEKAQQVHLTKREEKIRLLTEIKQREGQKQQLTSLGATCPTCKQEITADHTHSITSKLIEEIQPLQEKIAQLDEEIQALEEKKGKLERNIQKLTKHEQERLSALAVFKQSLLQKEQISKRKNSLEQERDTLLKELQELPQNKAPIASEETEQHIKQLEEEMNHLRDKELRLASQIAQLNERTEQLAHHMNEQVQQIKQLQSFTKRADAIAARITWMQEVLVPATEDIERTVFSSIHHEFDALVKKWFGIIMGDESLQLRLDDAFTPIITQNGHETEITSLSGGEKTAVALAYRLALNHCITHFAPMLGTKELLILDEPTDGFSEHQLDRMRDIIEELQVQQLIIVSHESKIEGYVEHIFQVHKDRSSSIQG